MQRKITGEKFRSLQGKYRIIKCKCVLLLPGLLLCADAQKVSAQSTVAEANVPDWALPGSATHQQVPPPPDFHRAARTEIMPIGR